MPRVLSDVCANRPKPARRIARVRVAAFLLLCLHCLAGCHSSSDLSETPIPVEDPKTAKPAYWLSKPSVARVSHKDYDRLWDACGDVARDELFDLDRQDYRDGLLTTKPLVSKQIFEPWRPDTGTFREVAQNSLQTVRRTIRFRFEKSGGAYTVAPKVLVERFAQPTKRITAAAQYRSVFAYTVPENANERQTGGVKTGEYWYAIGRDEAMETQLAARIEEKVGE